MLPNTYCMTRRSITCFLLPPPHCCWDDKIKEDEMDGTGITCGRVDKIKCTPNYGLIYSVEEITSRHRRKCEDDVKMYLWF